MATWPSRSGRTPCSRSWIVSWAAEGRMAQLFDEADLLERIDHDWEFLQETVDMLATDAPALLQEIRQAVESEDAAAVGRAAHTLKGMVANFCAAAPQATALELE